MDFEKFHIESTFKTQVWRVGALSWNSNLIAAGSRDKSVQVHDVRQSPKLSESNQVQGEDSYVPAFCFKGHKQEVCGLSFSPSGEMLASGGNDNRFIVWDLRRAGELFSSTKHSAAVKASKYTKSKHPHNKAIEWCPTRPNLVLSGGGTHDQTIKLWNTHTCGMVNSVDSGSQVCAIKFSPFADEFVSAHGYSQNFVNVWNMPQYTPKKFAVLQGHTSRVLHLAVSPDGKNIVTGAGDESLRFWEVFPERPPAPKQKGYPSGQQPSLGSGTGLNFTLDRLGEDLSSPRVLR